VSDDDIRAILGRALTDEPPVHFTRAEVIERGRRVRRKRRLVAGGSALASMAAVGAAVLIVAGFHGTAEPTIGPAQPPQTTCVRTTTVFQDQGGGVFAGAHAQSCACPADQEADEPGAVIGADGVTVRECVLLTPR
jgi:hypothetical protein